MNTRRDKFIERAKIVHKGENIIYDYVEYVNNRTPVKLYDADLKDDGTPYGEFWQTPYNHLRGQGHPLKKGRKISKSKRLTQEEVIARFKEVHNGEKLDYSKVKYVNMHTPVKIISKELRPDGTIYGEFWQEPAVHLKGCTHPEIGKIKQIAKQSLTKEEFIEKAKQVHFTSEYNYEFVDYVNNSTKVKVICNKKRGDGTIHGEFETSPDNFLQGKGCPKCGNSISKAEEEIIWYIEGLIDGKVIQRDRNILEGKELDIYVPSKNIAFEYNGLRWHSEEFGKDRYYHLNKKLACEKKGVNLFHIFEDEYIFHKEALFAKIKRIFGNEDGLKKIGARKCFVQEITNNDAKWFLDRNHIQGYSRATLHFGLYFGDSLLSVMSCTKRYENVFEIVRFASNIDYVVQGAFSKMLKHFIVEYKPNAVKTFLDRRWEMDCSDNLYTKCGFQEVGILKPDYQYTNGHGERLHKFGFRKQRLHKKYGLPLSMNEYEMAKAIGYYRVWNCGLVKYELIVDNK